MFKLNDDDFFDFDDQEFQELIESSLATSKPTKANKENVAAGVVKKLPASQENGLTKNCDPKLSTLGLGIHSAVVKKPGFSHGDAGASSPKPSPLDRPFIFTPKRPSTTPAYSPVHCVTVQRSNARDSNKVTPHKKRDTVPPPPFPNKVHITEMSPSVKSSFVLSPFSLLPNKGSSIVKRAETPKRKFPGPAGLLPRLPSGKKPQALRSTSFSELSPDASVPILELLPSSQNLEEVFDQPPWHQMMSDLKLDDGDPEGLLARFNIAWILEQATLRQLPRGKVPVLCAAIKSISPMGTEAGVVLHDKTGQIHGSLHRNLVEDYGTSLQPGSILVIQQASVLSPSVRKHHLNITPSNLVALYSEDGGFRTDVLVSGSQLLHQALRGLREEMPDNPTPVQRSPAVASRPPQPQTNNDNHMDGLLEGLSEEMLDLPMPVQRSPQAVDSRPPKSQNDHMDDLLEDDLDDIFREVTEDLPF